MSLMQWIFPIGAALTFVGVFSELILRWDASHVLSTPGFIGPTMAICLLSGSLLIIAGFIIDVKRLSGVRARRRGIVCWIIAGLSVSLMVVHHWGFDDTAIFLSVPAFCGFAGGLVLSLFSRS
jgi:hypothetical protein